MRDGVQQRAVSHRVVSLAALSGPVSFGHHVPLLLPRRGNGASPACLRRPGPQLHARRRQRRLLVTAAFCTTTVEFGGAVGAPQFWGSLPMSSRISGSDHFAPVSIYLQFQMFSLHVVASGFFQFHSDFQPKRNIVSCDLELQPMP